MASFASSATTCGARKHAWTNYFNESIPVVSTPVISSQPACSAASAVSPAESYTEHNQDGYNRSVQSLF